MHKEALSHLYSLRRVRRFMPHCAKSRKQRIEILRGAVLY